MKSEVKAIVSVVIPVYNVANYLSQCLDSLLMQTYENLEIIIVNDGSSDNTGQIADSYSKKDSRIKVIHQVNSGVSVARNVGLDAVIGEYVTFIDGDDWVDANWIESQIECINREDADLVNCACERVFQNTRIRYNTLPASNVISDYEEKKKLALGLDEWGHSDFAYGAVWKLLVKKQCLIDAKTGKSLRFIVDRNYCEDILFVLQVYRNVNRIAFNNNTVYHYRMRVSSAVSESKFCLKLSHTFFLMTKIGLVNDSDLLREEILRLYRISLVDPSSYEDWEKDLFHQIISTCREKLKVVSTMNLDITRKVFALLYLSAWPSYRTKYRIMKLAFAPLELVFRRRSKHIQMKFP